MVQLSLRVLTSLTMLAAAFASVHHASSAAAAEPAAVVSAAHTTHSVVAAPIADIPLDTVLSGDGQLLPVPEFGSEPVYLAYAETHGERAPPRR